MTKYQIWMEGCLITGMEGSPSRAFLDAEIEANSFVEACRKHYKNDSSFDEKRMTYWGCRLFDNEKDARRSFG